MKSPVLCPVIHPILSVKELNSWERNKYNRCTLQVKQRQKHTTDEPKVLLCHDFKGGYGQDAVIQGTFQSECVYSLQYWQFIDIFIYFSHNRISIPPLTWTQSAHSNGVQCLGTIICEWDQGTSETMELIYGPSYDLNRRSTFLDFSPFYADILVDIALFYGFDGWFVNIESSLPSSIHSFTLARFLRYLKSQLHSRLPGSILLWYDSLTAAGELKWQDSLNENNKVTTVLTLDILGFL